MKKKFYLFFTLSFFLIFSLAEAQPLTGISENFEGENYSLEWIDNSENGAYSFEVVDQALQVAVDKSKGKWSGMKLLPSSLLDLSEHPYLKIAIKANSAVTVGIGFVDSSGYDLNRKYINVEAGENYSTFYIEYDSWAGKDWGNGGVDVLLNSTAIKEIHITVDEGSEAYNDTLYIEEISVGDLGMKPLIGLSEDFNTEEFSLTWLDNSGNGAYSFEVTAQALRIAVDKSLGKWSGLKLIPQRPLDLIAYPYVQVKMKVTADVTVGIGFVDESGYDLNRTYINLKAGDEYEVFNIEFASWSGKDWENGGADVTLNPSALKEIHITVDEGSVAYKDTLYIDEIFVGNEVILPANVVSEDFSDEDYVMEWLDNSGNTKAYSFDVVDGALKIDVNKNNEPPTNWGGFFINSLTELEMSETPFLEIKAKSQTPAKYWIQLFDAADNYLAEVNWHLLATTDFVTYRMRFEPEFAAKAKKLLIIPTPGTSLYHEAQVIIDEISLGDITDSSVPEITSTPVGEISENQIINIPASTKASVFYNEYPSGNAFVIEGANIYQTVSPDAGIKNGMRLFVVVDGVVSQGLTLKLEDVTANNNTSEMVMDGLSQESSWESQQTYPIALVSEGTVSNESDLSGSYKVIWDEEGLYFFVSVTDDVIIKDSNDSYRDDGIDMFIDLNNSKGTTYDGFDDYHYAFRWNDEVILEHSFNAVDGVEFKIVDTDNGYDFEVKYPWTTIEVPGNPFTPSDGAMIGFNVQINDDDDGGERDAVIASHDPINKAWENPSTFGTMVLEKSTSAQTVKNKTSLLVFPNPANEVFTVHTNNTIAEINLYNTLGQKVYSEQNLNENLHRIFTGSFKNGVYILNVKTVDSKVANQRIVINKQ
ncbi:MAG: T9SS type A sorting domain-containing protein [Bacteroidales bacterium]|nr:T9SS type A sorting domain-containing protein [Bacteroidales bacterium]